MRTQRRKLKANIIIITTAIVIIFQNFRQKIILKYVTKILFDERRRKRGKRKTCKEIHVGKRDGQAYKNKVCLGIMRVILCLEFRLFVCVIL